MMNSIRENGFKIIGVLIVLAAFSPSALPHSLFQSLNQSQSALEHKHSPEAYSAINQALSFDPALQALHGPALELATMMGEWEKAETHLVALKALYPSSNQHKCIDLQIQLARGDIPVSAPDFAVQSNDCPGLVDSLRQLGNDLFNTGQFDLAAPLLNNYVTTQPGSSPEQTRLALYAAASDPENAIDQLRESQTTPNQFTRLALDLLILIQDNQNSDSPAYLYALVGQEFSRADEWYLAQIAFQNAVHLDPDYAQAWGYLGVALDNIGFDGEEALLEAVRLSPADPLLLILEAMHFNRSSDPSNALPILLRAAVLDDKNPAIAAELGHTYASLGDLESARLAYMQATLLAPEEPSFWQLLAEFSLGYELDITALGLPAARNALILQPLSSESWRSLGFAHYLQEDFALAERALLRAIDITPSDPTTQYYLGLLFQAQGRNDEAIAAWTMATMLSPDHSYAQLSQRALENLTLKP